MRARYQNIGALGVEGIDTAIRWAAGFSDLGLESIPGQLSLSVGGNFLLDQSQPVSVGGRIRNFAGYVGASRFRSNTVLGWSAEDTRVQLTWLYRKGTNGLLVNNNPSPTIAGYPSDHQFT